MEGNHLLGQLNDEDAALIVQLLHEDVVNAVKAVTGKGKHVEGRETDGQLAMKLFLEEINAAQTFTSDRRMTRSIQNAVRLDGAACLRSREEERMAREDRNMCLELSSARGGTASRSTPKANRNATDGTETETKDLIEKLACIYVTGIDDSGDSDSDVDNDDDTLPGGGQQPESSAWAASRTASQNKQDQKLRRRHCEACTSKKHFAELATAPCGHEYCRECLESIFRGAMTDEAYFPPRCCKKAIPLEQNRLFLSGELAGQFREKAIEYSTPNRTYCHEPSCAVFIPAANYVNGVATCGECRRRTCTTCKKDSHVGRDCPNDPELQRVIELAREQGWQRCQNCWLMVELHTGCNHMTCRCGHQFCYVCGTKWKTCRCAQWDEQRLFDRAVQIDARRPAAPARQAVAQREQQRREARDAQPQALVQQRRVHTLMQHLRDNHQCEHGSWSRRDGRNRCEECHDSMPLYIYECLQCRIMACGRCRYNRL